MNVRRVLKGHTRRFQVHQCAHRARRGPSRIKRVHRAALLALHTPTLQQGARPACATQGITAMACQAALSALQTPSLLQEGRRRATAFAMQALLGTVSVDVMHALRIRTLLLVGLSAYATRTSLATARLAAILAQLTRSQRWGVHHVSAMPATLATDTRVVRLASQENSNQGRQG